VLFEKGQVKKHTEIGQFELPISYIIDKDEGEEWFPIESKKDKIKGQVLIKYKYEFQDPDEILPTEEEPSPLKQKKKRKKIKY